MNKKPVRLLEKHTKTLSKYEIYITKLIETDEEYYYEATIKDLTVLLNIETIEKIITNKNKHNKALPIYMFLKYLSKKHKDNEINVDDTYLKEIIGMNDNVLIFSINYLTKLKLIKWQYNNDSCKYEILDNITITDYTVYEIEETYYIYRFINNENKVIYIGRTQNLDQRMKTHYGTKGHLPKQCYKNTKKIEYATCSNEIEMVLIEIYLINKYKPIYNNKDLYRGRITLTDFEKLEWKEYNIKELT